MIIWVEDFSLRYTFNVCFTIFPKYIVIFVEHFHRLASIYFPFNEQNWPYEYWEVSSDFTVETSICAVGWDIWGILWNYYLSILKVMERRGSWCFWQSLFWHYRLVFLFTRELETYVTMPPHFEIDILIKTRSDIHTRLWGFVMVKRVTLDADALDARLSTDAPYIYAEAANVIYIFIFMDVMH